MRTRHLITTILFSLPLTFAAALTFPIPQNGNGVVGRVQHIHTHKGETLTKLKQRFKMGYYEMIEANPGINRHSAIPMDESVTIPTQFVLPNVPREGIVINLPELRLYYYNKANNTIRTGPIAVGRYDWLTPTMTTKVIEKKKNPKWFVPKSIQEASAMKGIYLPDVVMPGPKNPLGKYALRLGSRSYLIHGTNAPHSIGKRASSGCIRMYSEDIKNLFNEVPVGTPVRIINEFYKLGWKNGILYLEVHEPLQEFAEPAHEQVRIVSQEIHDITRGNPTKINWHAVHEAIERQSGVPVAISSRVHYRTQPYSDYQSDHPSTYGTIGHLPAGMQ